MDIHLRHLRRFAFVMTGSRQGADDLLAGFIAAHPRLFGRSTTPFEVLLKRLVAWMRTRAKEPVRVIDGIHGRLLAQPYRERCALVLSDVMRLQRPVVARILSLSEEQLRTLLSAARHNLHHAPPAAARDISMFPDASLMAAGDD